MWTLIPQLFYDLLARIVPGATIVLVSTLVIFSPSATVKFILNSQKTTNFFSAWSLIIVILICYMVGLVMGQIWEFFVGSFTKKRDKQIEKDCKEQCLKEHNQFLKSIGYPEIDIQLGKLPRAFVMRDHLRLVAPSEAARILKVRAERRSCQVLIMGFSILIVFNTAYLLSDLKPDRIILEIVLPLVIVPLLSGANRLYRLFINGTVVLWLMLVSSNQIPMPKPDAKLP